MIRVYNPFWNNASVREMVTAFVRQYPKMVERLEEFRSLDALSVSEEHDGMPRGNGVSDPTAKIAVRKAAYEAALEREIRVIDEARKHIDPLYREAVWAAALGRQSKEKIAERYAVSKTTIRKHLYMFHYEIAVEMGWMTPEDWGNL